jgi:uncharacterized membrane protein YhaH (DUF805 family)
MSWYLEVLKKYATFTGRARRKEYWMFFLFNFIFASVAGMVDIALGLGDSSGGGLVYSLYVLAMLIPGLAVGVRRMHDTDHSGWWLLIPLVNFVFAVTEGTRGPNRFGPDPKLSGYGMAAPPTAPAGWMTDPTGRHQLRYWDGAIWTQHVSDNGAPGADPLG